MATTTDARQPATAGNAASQDAWISAFVGQKVDRTAKRAGAPVGAATGQAAPDQAGDVKALLGEVDAAIADLKDACEGVADPQSRTVLDGVVAEFARNRDALAAAADP